VLDRPDQRSLPRVNRIRVRVVIARGYQRAAVRTLIANGYMHAFPDGKGTIKVSLERHLEHVEAAGETVDGVDDLVLVDIDVVDLDRTGG
jgi:hypothetical protein